jgi:hypothetical protein
MPRGLLDAASQGGAAVNGQLLAVMGAAAMAALACSLPFSPTVEDRTEPIGVDSSGSSGGGSAEVLLEDDFSDTSSGWEQGDYEGGRVGYGGGGYQVESIGDGNVMWGIAGRDFEDVVIEVSATQLSAPTNDNNGYGVACRLQQESDGYYLLVSGDGYYTIIKSVSDEWTNLVDWTESDAINQGNASNSIRATCDGDTLTLEVNGELVATATDTQFTSGDIGMAAVSYEATSTQVQFDDIRVTRP